jgi:hypothetical protein
MRARLLFAITLLAVNATIHAQQNLDVVVKRVNDRRTSGQFFAQLVITLELPGVKTSEMAASRVIVASAMDDTGRDLIDHEAGEPMLDTNQLMNMQDKAAPAQVSATLKNPDRKAGSVKEVRGEIELFMPAKDPNSLADLAKFVPQSGKPLTHKALKANGVEITVLTPAQIDAERKRRLDAKKKEYADYSYDAETLKSVLDSFTESNLVLEENEIVARVKDPNQRIQDMTYLDAAGQPQHVSVRDDEGVTRLSTWVGKPQPDWKLRVTMRTPKNTSRFPFVLKNVTLP